MLREPLPAKPSPALRRAYERAQQFSITKSRDRRADDRARARREADGDQVDGQPVPTALLDAERPTDPGEHVIEASGPDMRCARHRSARARREATGRTRARARSPQRSRPAPASESGAITRCRSRSRRFHLRKRGARRRLRRAAPAAATPNHTAAYVTWGAGAVALAIGAGFGIAALTRTDTLRAQCDGNACPASARGKLDTAKQYGTISTIGFGTGIAARRAGRGAVLEHGFARARARRTGAPGPSGCRRTRGFLRLARA